ncbi:type I restriction endonuclease subunit R [Phormidium tenue]|uniref:Type I restriction enzyme endonuclease subunit n=1 Tax=Phormidium tenue NIES-30 TaxID=549789 RepID=A0A1U7J9B0_9CYAN|nr:type I restriction endonuclease subunit R [Phormidium tenue]MBD2230967.1 type I restriction endonuclease subunit R [Phormidium tenue FACHB-1052]OKH49998.1 DEAD/DEAH box helicase [Phormidium tenue NIES-30]
MKSLTEFDVEESALYYLEQLGYTITEGSNLDSSEFMVERESRSEVILESRLRSALTKLNPQVPALVLDEAIQKVLRSETQNLFENNRRFHSLLIDGVSVSYQHEERLVHEQIWLIDFCQPSNNDWLAVNQFTVHEYADRRPDIVLFLNGLPLAVIELKNAADGNADIDQAFNQLQTYKRDIPSLFIYNQGLVISDGINAQVGTLTSGRDRFMPWRNPPSEADSVASSPERLRSVTAEQAGSYSVQSTNPLEVLLKGVFHPERYLDLIRYFTVFESDGETLIKKVAGYHQYYAVNKAVEATIRATSVEGDKRAGVIWHTQGSGKSLSMVFYAGKIIQHPDMANPTLVVLTDRNDLDDQLYTTFSKCQDLLRQTPQQAEGRADLQAKLQVASGGIIFTTIQKFAPEERGGEYETLSNRRNIVFIADEAHRSQYGLEARVVTTKDKETGIEGAYTAYGFAKYLRDALPNASFIGFTGTPIEAADKNTKQIFGNYIDIYDIQRAVEDGATVKIYYEARLAKIDLDDNERPHIDPDFEEVTEGEETTTQAKLKSKWAQLEAMVGTPKRLSLVAADIVQHFENRLASMDGKGLIVCMSRRICADLYNQLVALRPKWHSEDDATGTIKVVMTGSAADPENFQPHIRSKKAREALAKRLRDPNDPLKLVIVRDMWLTGFDAPCLHTMYVDKPMKGHNLMQAIARVNRVFGDKQGGLVVDYIGIFSDLQEALQAYTERDRGQAGILMDQALTLMQEKYEIVAGQFHGFDYHAFHSAPPPQRLTILRNAMDWMLRPESVDVKGPQRYIQAVTELSKAFALCAAEDAALAIREDVGFFQAVKAGLSKHTVEGGKSRAELDAAVRQIVSRSVASEQVIDIFETAGLDKPELSILSDQFLAEVRDLPQKNLALEVLRKLLNDEIKARSRKNVVQSRNFSEMLEASIRRYQNRTITSAEVIQELINLAEDMREASRRGIDLGLSEDELAFYDALEVNDSAVQVLGDETLKTIAQELVKAIRGNVTIDWTEREAVRAKLRVMVKRLLKKYGYPPDKQEKATQTVLQQAETLCKDWAA